MIPLDPLLNIVHHANEHLIQPVWEQVEPLLQDLGSQALQSIDPQQVAQLVPDQTWQNVQNFVQAPDYSQPQTYEPAPSFEQPSQHSQDFQSTLSVESNHALVDIHHTVGLRTGFEPDYHLNEANKALADAAYHTDQAATHAVNANWYTENHDKVVFGDNTASYEGKWASDEAAKAAAKLKEAADEMAKASTAS